MTTAHLRLLLLLAALCAAGCYPDHPAGSLTDADGDGVAASDDCDDNNAELGARAADGDCDGILMAEDCDDDDTGAVSSLEDADCDGVLTDDDCNDSSADVDADGVADGSLFGARADDADCDGVLTDGLDGVPGNSDDDCNDDNVAQPNLDADCDGVLTADDCNDSSADVDPADGVADGSPFGAQSGDADCDGVLTAEDCDDDNASQPELDADCDGVRTDDDCDDNADTGAALGAFALDADCDGVLTDLDCDDSADSGAALGAFATDADCDGVLTADDCNDSSADVDPTDGVADGYPYGAVANDGDCDGFVTADDCDDADPTRHPGAEELCDGVDNDCDGTLERDDDLDGFYDCEDCHDHNADLHPYDIDGDGQMDDCGWRDLATGAEHTCGIKSNGGVVCWGDATWGQLAFPATLGVVKEISAGQYFTCVIKQTGELACWGYDANSQVSHLPVGTSYRGLSAGGHHSCVLDETGEIRCWGAGSGQTSQPCSAPYYECGQSIPPPATGYSSLAMGGFQSCALDANGAPSCWGYTLNGVTTPPSLVLFLELSGGLNHACGITNTNTLRCWGWGSATTPGTCASDANCGQSLPPPGTFGYVAAGGRHSCATDLTTGLVSCWGDNSHGQINAPTTVAFRQLSLGTEHSCGITEEGLMQCWGNGSITSTGDCQSNYNCGQSIVP